MRHERRRDDQGMSLIEMIITMGLMAVVSGLMLTGVISTNKLFRVTSDETTGQTDIRATIERLGRDVRDARSLDAGATASQLVLWIDSNSNYRKDASEIVTWALASNSHGQYDVTRTVNGVTRRSSAFVISQLAFCYKTDPTATACLTTPLTSDQASKVTVITSDIEYDALTGNAAQKRHAYFSERLRNVSAS